MKRRVYFKKVTSSKTSVGIEAISKFKLMCNSPRAYTSFSTPSLKGIIETTQKQSLALQSSSSNFFKYFLTLVLQLKNILFTNRCPLPSGTQDNCNKKKEKSIVPRLSHRRLFCFCGTRKSESSEEVSTNSS